jgi:anti-sigma B factor antagonist
MSGKYQSHWLERQDSGAVTIVRLKAPKLLDEDTVRAAFDPINALVGEVGRTKLVLNLAAIESLPSMALAKLVLLSWKAQAGGGRLALCHAPPTVAARLASKHLGGLFDVYATEQEAVQSFS